MSRKTKSQHQNNAINLADGRPVHWTALFQSPKTIAAHGGRNRPTVAEYYEINLGRRRMAECRLDAKIEIRRTKKIQHRRKIAKR